MKKNGFTLIELLAVIVILAIIALIATPIILGIINDTREKANERSVELYASAVRNAVAAYQLTGTSTPKSFSDLTIQYDGDVKCIVQELYEDGSFYLDKCKVNNGEKEYSYGTKQGASIEVGKMSICNPISVQTVGAYTAGDKYECDVDPYKEGYDYIFYVLNFDATSVNLIMDSNITSTGIAIKDANPSDTGLVAWGDRENGPILAMDYLHTATQNWTNLNLITMDTFEIDNTTLTMGKIYETYARLPYKSEVESGISNYLEFYGGASDEYYEIREITPVLGVYGFWTLTLHGEAPCPYIKSTETIEWGNAMLDSSDYAGVRPVINLLI